MPEKARTQASLLKKPVAAADIVLGYFGGGAVSTMRIFTDPLNVQDYAKGNTFSVACELFNLEGPGSPPLNLLPDTPCAGKAGNYITWCLHRLPRGRRKNDQTEFLALKFFFGDELLKLRKPNTSNGYSTRGDRFWWSVLC